MGFPEQLTGSFREKVVRGDLGGRGHAGSGGELSEPASSQRRHAEIQTRLCIYEVDLSKTDHREIYIGESLGG